MPYKSITNQFLELIDWGERIIRDTRSANEQVKREPTKKEEIIKKVNDLLTAWRISCDKFLTENELLLEYQEFISYSGSAFFYQNFDPKLNNILKCAEDRKKLLIKFAKDIEEKQDKEVIILKIDDFDNFEEVRSITVAEVEYYSKDCFLEDDVKDAFLEKLGEPYNEPHSGAETRDLFSDRLEYSGKRLAAVFMFKGKGEPGELVIKKAGSTGNQFLKLAKNNSAECFIVQHTNKISPDAREALQDHVLQNTRLSKVYICFIDGVDTARFLKSVGRNLEELKNKK